MDDSVTSPIWLQRLLTRAGWGTAVRAALRRVTEAAFRGNQVSGALRHAAATRESRWLKFRHSQPVPVRRYQEEQMTNTTTTAAEPRRSAGQWIIVAVLGILGILALVAAILFITGTANHIHFLSGSSHHGVHDIRLAVCIVVGVLLLAAAGYFARSSSKA
jgi:hypothetical protein